MKRISSIILGLFAISLPLHAEILLTSDVSATPEPAPAARPVPRATQPTVRPATQNNRRYGPVRSDDTLWQIGRQTRPNNRVSIHQNMVAIYRKNPDAFRDGNINQILDGSYLQLPTATEINQVPRQQAQSIFTRLVQSGPSASQRSATPESVPQSSVRSTPAAQAVRTPTTQAVSQTVVQPTPVQPEIQALNAVSETATPAAQAPSSQTSVKADPSPQTKASADQAQQPVTAVLDAEENAKRLAAEILTPASEEQLELSNAEVAKQLGLTEDEFQRLKDNDLVLKQRLSELYAQVESLNDLAAQDEEFQRQMTLLLERVRDLQARLIEEEKRSKPSLMDLLTSSWGGITFLALVPALIIVNLAVLLMSWLRSRNDSQNLYSEFESSDVPMLDEAVPTLDGSMDDDDASDSNDVSPPPEDSVLMFDEDPNDHDMAMDDFFDDTTESSSAESDLDMLFDDAVSDEVANATDQTQDDVINDADIDALLGATQTVDLPDPESSLDALSNDPPESKNADSMLAQDDLNALLSDNLPATDEPQNDLFASIEADQSQSTTDSGSDFSLDEFDSVLEDASADDSLDSLIDEQSPTSSIFDEEMMLSEPEETGDAENYQVRLDEVQVPFEEEGALSSNELDQLLGRSSEADVISEAASVDEAVEDDSDPFKFDALSADDLITDDGISADDDLSSMALEPSMDLADPIAENIAKVAEGDVIGIDALMEDMPEAQPDIENAADLDSLLDEPENTQADQSVSADEIDWLNQPTEIADTSSNEALLNIDDLMAEAGPATSDADMPDLALDVGLEEFPEMLPEQDLDIDAEAEVGSKLDLARAYIEIDDREGARQLLQHVLDKGNPIQREEAEQLLTRLT